MALILYRPIFWLVLLFLALLLFWIARNLRLRWWPAYLLRLLLLALIVGYILIPKEQELKLELPRREVLVLDEFRQYPRQSARNEPARSNCLDEIRPQPNRLEIRRKCSTVC